MSDDFNPALQASFYREYGIPFADVWSGKEEMSFCAFLHLVNNMDAETMWKRLIDKDRGSPVVNDARLAFL